MPTVTTTSAIKINKTTQPLLEQIKVPLNSDKNVGVHKV